MPLLRDSIKLPSEKDAAAAYVHVGVTRHRLSHRIRPIPLVPLGDNICPPAGAAGAAAALPCLPNLDPLLLLPHSQLDGQPNMANRVAMTMAPVWVLCPKGTVGERRRTLPLPPPSQKKGDMTNVTTQRPTWICAQCQSPDSSPVSSSICPFVGRRVEKKLHVTFLFLFFYFLFPENELPMSLLVKQDN